MASKFTIDRDTGAWVIGGRAYDGLAKVCQTEAEARAYIARRRSKDAWAAFAVIERPSPFGRFSVVTRCVTRD
jgi:hypothetical protein